MTKMVLARFDGEVLRFEEPVDLAPDTVVRVLVEDDSVPADRPYSFIEAALSMDLEGPADWSERLDDYLYGDGSEARD